jgi:nitroimidazol reductase NimA-like FMN-containing flavoprotein (pyridoxamine 5'-phosphate oxidase superfamily)
VTDGDRFDAQGILRLEEDECWRFLARHWLGRVGLVHLDQPMIFPVGYVIDRQSVVFRTAPGTKLSLAGMGAPAVFEVDEASELFETGTSVMVHGTLHEITRPDERERLGSLPLRTWAPGDRDHLVRIDARSVSGRRIGRPHLEEGMDADGG